jgi:flagellar motor switch protein FliG
LGAANKISGKDKAALILMSLGNEVAADILRQLPPSDIKTVLAAMQRIGKIPSAIVDDVMREFQSQLSTSKPSIQGGSDAVSRLVNALSKNSGPSRNFDMAAMGGVQTLNSLRNADPVALATIVQREHPQTGALIIAHCEHAQASTILKKLSENVRTELMLRVARLEAVDPETLAELDESLTEQLRTLTNHGMTKVGGAEQLAKMLNVMEPTLQEQMLSQLEDRDPKLAEAVRAFMFTFDDLSRLTARSWQMLLSKVPQPILIKALKTAREDILTQIQQNMSSRAWSTLKEDIDNGGKIRLQDVSDAQTEVMRIAKRLLDEGSLELSDANATMV